LIKDQAGEAAIRFSAQFAKATQLVTQAFVGIDAGEAAVALMEAVKTTANLVIGAFVAACHATTGAWDAVGLGITNSIVGAMNAVIAAVERAANCVATIQRAGHGPAAIAAPTMPTPHFGAGFSGPFAVHMPIAVNGKLA
jgi:hypothetical protein